MSLNLVLGNILNVFILLKFWFNSDNSYRHRLPSLEKFLTAPTLILQFVTMSKVVERTFRKISCQLIVLSSEISCHVAQGKSVDILQDCITFTVSSHMVYTLTMRKIILTFKYFIKLDISTHLNLCIYGFVSLPILIEIIIINMQISVIVAFSVTVFNTIWDCLVAVMTLKE
jgi:hypothetical protein